MGSESPQEPQPRLSCRLPPPIWQRRDPRIRVLRQAFHPVARADEARAEAKEQTVIKHIPGARCAPRTTSEANRRAEGDAIVRRIKDGDCSPLHSREAAPNLRPLLWAVGLCAVCVVLMVAEALWGWKSVVGGVVALVMVAWCFRAASMNYEEHESVSEERPHVERGEVQ